MKVKQFLTFIAFAKQYIAKFPKERSPLTFALSRLITKYKKVFDDIESKFNDKREELDAKHCIKLEGGAFSEREVTVGNQVVFRKNFNLEGEEKKRKDYDKFESEIFDTDVDFEPYFVDVPTGIDISWVNEFTGFVFKEMTEEELEKWYLAQETKVVQMSIEK